MTTKTHQPKQKKFKTLFVNHYYLWYLIMGLLQIMVIFNLPLLIDHAQQNLSPIDISLLINYGFFFLIYVGLIGALCIVQEAKTSRKSGKRGLLNLLVITLVAAINVSVIMILAAFATQTP